MSELREMLVDYVDELTREIIKGDSVVPLFANDMAVSAHSKALAGVVSDLKGILEETEDEQGGDL